MFVLGEKPKGNLPRDPYTKVHLPFVGKVTDQHRPPEILVRGIAHLQGHGPVCLTIDWIDYPFSDWAIERKET